MINALWGLLGGFLAWFVTAFVGQPLYRFMALRAETARVLALHERELPLDDQSLIDVGMLSPIHVRSPRTKEYRECGAQLIAFAATNPFVISFFDKMGSFHPRSAGESLIALADAKVGTEAAGTLAKVSSALRL